MVLDPRVGAEDQETGRGSPDSYSSTPADYLQGDGRDVRPLVPGRKSGRCGSEEHIEEIVNAGAVTETSARMKLVADLETRPGEPPPKRRSPCAWWERTIEFQPCESQPSMQVLQRSPLHLYNEDCNGLLDDADGGARTKESGWKWRLSCASKPNAQDGNLNDFDMSPEELRVLSYMLISRDRQADVADLEHLCIDDHDGIIRH